jgi:8-oxo-dGTP pyrophosphatase MutT (NUDIX family)
MKYIQDIKDRITMGLPGESAHHEMISELRTHQMMQFTHKNKPSDAAVLILLYQKNNEWYIPFIKRAEDNHAHSGQIALPGGRYEKTDADFSETALRETEEEIGISRELILPVGQLTRLYIPPSNYNVYPFIGEYTGGEIEFTPDKKEVDYVIEVPVKELTNPTAITSREFNVRELRFSTPCFNIQGNIIWGATAMIINEFLSLMK